MTMMVTEKLQDFTVCNKIKKTVRILFVRNLYEHPELLFSPGNSLNCVKFEGQRFRSTGFENDKVCELSDQTLSRFLLVCPKF